MSKKWHPVLNEIGEPNLPKKSGEYNVYLQEPFYKENDDYPFDSLSYVTSAFYDKDSCIWKFSDGECVCANINCVNTNAVYFVSHWMSFPNPPKERYGE